MKEPNCEETIFAGALALPPEERAAYLGRACDGDAALRRRVEVLLNAHAAGAFLEEPAAALAAHTRQISPQISERPGDSIGRYKLLQQIGEGGCGVVYMAEQSEPVQRRVALKIIKLGMDTKQVIARFEAERQALALMDRPNIAKVLDGGATEAGRPYFVMELVRGVRITEFCDHNNLPTRERLNLFLQVCRAIQHAHQKGIIHRDIKPSNILLTINDGVPVPKVIDFGIAKATQGRLTNKTVFTAFEQFIGTPAYVSPEQAVMTSLDIDTRSDIYSLGVLLYELLTGKTPFDSKELLEAGFDAMRRTIQEKQPQWPSTKLSTMLEGELTTTANRHHTAAPRLISSVRGDLDWIVMKCLEKDRGRRYETANGLARDLERHLNEEPVTACPPSKLYRFRKLVRRNRLAFAAGSIVATSLLIGLGLATWMFTKERQENQRANAEEKKTLAEAANSEREAARARRAEAEAKAKLWDSYLAQAQAKRFSRHPGRRYEALQSLKKAAEIRPALELRNEAIASLALTDLRVGRQWELEHGFGKSYDSGYERYAYWRTNGVLSIRRIQDDSEVMRLSGTFPQIGLLKFSPDGRWLAVTRVTNGLELEVWDLDRNQVAVRFPDRDCHRIDFSSDGRLVAISFHNRLDTNNPVVIYDLVANRIESTLENGALPRTLRFHVTKPQLAISSYENNEVLIWDLETRKVMHRLLHPHEISEIAWSPEGDVLASGCGDYQVYLWNVATERPVHILPGHSGFPVEISFSYDGQFLASRGWDGALCFWDPWTGQQLFKLSVAGFTSGFSSANYRYGYNPGRDKMGFFELEPSRECLLLRPGSMLSARGQSCDFSADGRLLLTAHEDGARLWNPTSGKVVAFLDEKQTRFAIFEPHDDKFLFASDNGIKEWTIRRDLAGHIAEVVSSRPISDAAADELTLSRSGAALEFSVGNSIHVLNMTTGVEKIFDGPGDWRLYTSLSPDGQLVACGQICDLMTKGGACPVRLHKVANGELVWEVPQREGARPLFSPNGKWLLTGDNREYCLWDLETRRLVYSIPRGDVGYTAFMAFSRDSSTVALALSRDTVRLIEAVSGRELATLEAPEAHDIYWLRFSPDGSRLAVLYRDGPVHIWDLRLIRGQLAEMNLDWELPPLPGADKESAAQILQLSR